MEDKRRRRLSTDSRSDNSDDEDRNEANKPERDLAEDISEYESITETYDDDDTYDETTTEGGTEFTEGDYDERWIDEERQSGDGQEQPADGNEVSLDDDEDRKNPAYIPRKGAFYEHDDRLDEEDAEPEPKEEPDDEKLTKKKLWVESQKWSHDKFVDELQAPKSCDEIVALYGYDIRARSEPPQAPPTRGSRPRANRDRRNRLHDFIPDYRGGRGDQRRYNQRDREDRDPSPNNRDPPRTDRDPPRNDRDTPQSDQDLTWEDRGPTRDNQDAHNKDTRSSDYKPAAKNQPRSSHNQNYYRRETNSQEPARHNGHRNDQPRHDQPRHDQPRHETPVRGRGSGHRGRGRANSRSYSDASQPPRDYSPRSGYHGNRPHQSYSNLRNRGREYRDNVKSYEPPSPPDKWLEAPVPEQPPPPLDKQLSDSEEYYYYEDIVPPVTTPYPAPRTAPPTHSSNHDNSARNQPRSKSSRKAASEDDLLDILPPTTTVYTASRTQRPHDQEGHLNKGQGRPPKRYSSQRQRTVGDTAPYGEGLSENTPPVTMAVTKAPSNHGNMSQAPPFMTPVYGQKQKGGPPNKQRNPNAPPVPRQQSPRQQNQPRQRPPRQPHHVGGVPGGKPPGPLPPGQQAMFVRPRNPNMPYTQPRMLGPLATMSYTGGGGVAGRAGHLYTSPPAVTSLSSQQIPPFIPPAQAVINYGPPPSGHFQIPQAAVPMQLPPGIQGGQQDAVHYPASPQPGVNQGQEVVQVRGGTVYFSPEMQAQSDGVHIRGGTTYFNPGQQVVASTRQAHRQKTAIPIVNPETVVGQDGQVYTNVQGQVYYYPDDSQVYEYSASQGAPYDYYNTYEEPDKSGHHGNHYQPANKTAGKVNSTNQSQGTRDKDQDSADGSGSDSEECATPTNEEETTELKPEHARSDQVSQALNQLSLTTDKSVICDPSDSTHSWHHTATDSSARNEQLEEAESSDKVSRQTGAAENVSNVQDNSQVDEFSECVETLSTKTS